MAFCEQCGAQIADDSVFANSAAQGSPPLRGKYPQWELIPVKNLLKKRRYPSSLSAATEASGFVRTENTAGSTSFPC